MAERYEIKRAGAFRVRSGEASPAEIVPHAGPCPRPSRSMPWPAVKLLRIWERTDRG